MQLLFARMTRSLPLMIALAVLAIIIYFVVMYRSSPNHAKEVLIKVFTWLTLALSAFFVLACLYSWLEHNELAFEFMASFLVVSLIALAIVRICRAVFLKNNPKYRKKATKTTKGRRLK